MKKAVCLLLSAAFLLLSGCADTTPLKEKLIVEGIAVDSHEQGFLVTVQVYSPSADNTGQSQHQLFSAVGKTVYEGLRRVDENVGKTSYYSDTKVIIFSYDSLKKGLWKNLEFFIRSSEIGTNVCLASTMKKAAELLSIEKEGNNMPAKVLSNALHYGKTNSIPFSGQLMAVSAQLLNPHADASIPVVEVEKKADKNHPVLCGELCFRDQFPAVYMTEKHKWAYNWMHEFYDDRAFTVTFHDQIYAMQIRRCKRSITATVSQGHPAFFVELSLACDITETNTPDGVTLSMLDDFRQTVEKQVELMLKETVDAVFFAGKSDVFDFGRALQKYQPDFFKSIADWRKEIPACRVDCQAKVIITHVGQGNVE